MRSSAVRCIYRFLTRISLSATLLATTVPASANNTVGAGPGVNENNFSIRWTGQVEATATGTFQFQTRSNAGVRLWINGNLVIDNWNSHATVNDATGNISLAKNQRYAITMEYYDTTGTAVAKLYWKRPGETTFAIVPTTRLYAN